MRLAWFTPFSRRSAIALYSRIVVEALAARTEVDILLPAGIAGDEVDTDARVVRYAPEDLVDMLAAYDCAIFNMGDSAYHFTVWDALCAAHDAMQPSIAILHDTYYLNFFDSYATAMNRPGTFRDWVVDAYGDDGRSFLAALREGRASPAELHRHALYQPIVQRADAFIVHSRFCRERVGLGGSADVLELFIPIEYARAGAIVREAVETPAGERVLLLGMGVGTRNKNLHLVLEALASDRRLARQVEFCFVGAIAQPYLDELRQYAERRGLEHVRFPGYVPDSQLHGLLARADICINLRQPCLEGGSASLVEMLAAAKPVIVYDDGLYADLPDECACKLAPRGEARDLAAALRELVADPGRRRRMGEAAARHVSACTVSRYVDSLLAFVAERQEAFAVQRSTRDSARRAAGELQRIGATSSPYARTVVDALSRWSPTQT